MTEIRPTSSPTTRVPGLVLAVVVAVVATLIGIALPVVGGPVAGVVLGLAVGAWLGPRRGALRPGLTTASKLVLQIAVVLLGARLSIRQVAEVGWQSLPVMLGTLAVCLLGAVVIGRLMGVDRELRTLIGVGTAICGASAIAAVTPVIRARGTGVAYALSTVFACNIAAVLLFPPLGHLLGMDQQTFGLLAGTAVNDTSSVVAASASFGAEAADHAVVVKLARTLMIIPITAVLAILVARRDRADDVATRPSMMRMVPWFLVGFLLLAGVNSLGLVPGSWHGPLAAVATFLITVALSAIGLSTDIPALRAAGARPMVLGVVLWVLTTVTALVLIALTG